MFLDGISRRVFKGDGDIEFNGKSFKGALLMAGVCNRGRGWAGGPPFQKISYAVKKKGHKYHPALAWRGMQGMERQSLLDNPD